MASPSMVQRSGDTLIVRSVVSGDRLFMDMNQSSLLSAAFAIQGGLPAPVLTLPLQPLPAPLYTQVEEGSPPLTGGDLPQCKIKRNYNCVHCNYFTQNPRHFLTHLRDVHDEKVKIYDCPHCLYASKHFQKLLRHMKMVHGTAKGVEPPASNKRKVREPTPEPGPRPVLSEELDMDEFIEKEEPPAPPSEPPVIPPVKSTRGNLKCSLCPFITNVAGLLTKHERKEHVKTKFFPCGKCNYVTHIKARFTKHVKYHSMPMIKCEVCDFRTPYKWNLDRHMKNHGGTGAFCCSVCNFTADIKQSLTVHEMNHHVPPAGQPIAGTGTGRRRNKVGGSDVLNAQTGLSTGRAPEHDTSTGDSIQSEFTDMAMMTDNSNDRLSSSSKADGQEIDSNVDSLQNANEFINYDMFPKADLPIKPSLCEELNLKALSKKVPRPIPNLIPLQLQVVNQPQKNCQPTSAPLNLTTIQKSFSVKSSDDVKYISSSANVSDHYDDSNDQGCDNMSTRGSDESSQQSIQVSTQTIFKKKNASFFDKLKEKLLTTSAESGDLSCKDCGHLSKCLSEHSVHEKMCSNAEAKSTNSFASAGSGSTRCQYCRHRCKSSLDLIIHIQSCSLAGKDSESADDKCKTDKIEMPIRPESEDEASVDDPQVRHPMENVVFVWNKMLHQGNSSTFDNSQNENPSDMTMEETLSKGNHTSTPNNSDQAGGGKKVFKCPHCSFWASTASRFHVHIVGHLNKKPFECSLCAYRSNWRWDITKHIRLKSVRDPDHSKARVLMTDETGRRNYSKYNKYLTLMQSAMAEPSDLLSRKASHHESDRSQLLDQLDNTLEHQYDANFAENSILDEPLPLQDTLNSEEENQEFKKTKKTMWKCKKCAYRNTSKDALLLHVRKHSKYSHLPEELKEQDRIRQETAENNMTNANGEIIGSLSYRCGHCYQVSNWKHVIQRHCRLKHNGDVRVIVGEKGFPDKLSIPRNPPSNSGFDGICSKCPFTSSDRKVYEMHVKKHTLCPDSIFKCFICSYFVNTEQELVQHLPLHGITEPEQYIANILSCKTAGTETGTGAGVPLKRYKCTDCPYESNSKSQFMYHEQFHKAGDAPFKCDICSYQVSKRHLLHQHMKVHGIPTPKDIAYELHMADPINITLETSHTELVPMWTSVENQFQKVFKCRFCPLVQQEKQNILDHENMHNKDINGVLKCPNCTFGCSRMDVLFTHSEVHNNTYPKVICQVYSKTSDEEQINHLREFINIHENDNNMLGIEQVDLEEMCIEEDVDKIEQKSSDKVLFFCSHCPARFLFERELQIHTKFHNIRLPYQCHICSYTARQQSHLMAHNCVHSEEYQAKTRGLQGMHPTHPQFLQPKVVGVASGVNLDVSEPVWIVVTESKKSETIEIMDVPMEIGLTDDNPSSKSSSAAKHFVCNQCPAKFFKNSALHYHISLHGGNGAFKCKQCNYAVKTSGNLRKHQTVHDHPENVPAQNDYESGDDMVYKQIPLSGTDLFQHKTAVEKRALSEKLVTRPNDHFPPVLQADPQFGLLMHGNPDFIYPTYLKNGRQKEKRYKCHKCPSAFEKREQYKVHLSLHGSKQRYKCELCDYSVKYYANYVQHMRKHQMNADAHAKRQNNNPTGGVQGEVPAHKSIQLAIKTLPQHSTHKEGGAKRDRCLSLTDQQTLNLMNRRRSSAASNKEAVEEKKTFRCMYCPYSNQRRDALDNHVRRHAPGAGGNFECPHCQYAAPQSQFLRDHLKCHFNTQKNITPDYFTNFDGLEVYITRLDETGNSNEQSVCIYKAENVIGEDTELKSNNEEPKMYVIPSTGERVS